MSKAFEIRMTAHRNGIYWFKVKGRYDVRVDTVSGEANCTCQGDTFKQGGRKQIECKHLQKAREVLKVLKEANK